MREVNKCNVQFIECNKSTFNKNIKESCKMLNITHNFSNPFIESKKRGFRDGLYMG